MAKAKIKNKIRKLRFENGEMTQDTRQTIVALEQEKYVPSLALAFRIARVFSVPLDKVFEYEDGEGQC